MSWRTTAILFVVLLVVAAFAFLQNQQAAEEATPFPTPTPSIELVSGVTADDVQRLEIRRFADDALAVFTRETDGSWFQTEPTTTEVVSSTMSSRATSLTNMASRSTLPAEANPLTAYGLEDPAYQITLVALRGSDTVRFNFLVGNETPTAEGYYVLKEGDPRVHVALKLTVENTVGLIDEPPIPEPTATPSIQSDTDNPPTPSP